MLDMGFIPDIERIFKLTPFTRQTLFFSATMAPEITRITQEFLQNPERVEVARQATTGENITQKICMFTPSNRTSEAKEKREVLREILKAEGDAITNGIIFCNRKSSVDIVMKSLKKHGFDAGAIHGDLDQSVRMRVLDGFRGGDLKLLVASDVAARGLDIPAVSHVINFDVPIHSEDYVHRIGRTGRAGRDGKAITLCMPFEQKYLDKIEELVEKQIERMDTPALSSGSSKPRSRSEKPASTGDKSEQRTEKPAPRTRKKPEQAKPAAQQAEKPATPAAPKTEAPRRGRSEPKNQTVGMGEHVPAFLLRPLEITRAKTTKEPAKTSRKTAEKPASKTKTAAKKPTAKSKESDASVSEPVSEETGDV